MLYELHWGIILAFTKDTKLPETAPWFKLCTYVILEVLYKLHCDIILAFIKDTKLPETAL